MPEGRLRGHASGVDMIFFPDGHFRKKIIYYKQFFVLIKKIIRKTKSTRVTCKNFVIIHGFYEEREHIFR